MLRQRSTGTTVLVALMAAHRSLAGRAATMGPLSAPWGGEG